MTGSDEFSSTYIVNIIFNAFLCFTAITLNSITIHAIRNTSSLPKPLKTLLLSLAVSDLSVGLLAHPLCIAILGMYLEQNIQKNIGVAFSIIVTFLSCASLFVVMALTIDRFLAIQLHLRYQELVTQKRVVAVVISIIVLSSLISSSPFWVPHEWRGAIYYSIEIVCLVVITILYCRIYSTVRRHRNQIQSLQVQQDEGQNQEMMTNVARRVKLAVGIFYVYLVFLVCYLPTICRKTAALVSGEITAPRHLRYYFWTMVLLNSSLNPLIYCWKMRHIRHAVINIMQDILPCYT